MNCLFKQFMELIATLIASLDAEVQALKTEIDRIAGSTTFNNINILDGSYSANFQIGYQAGDTVALALNSISTDSLGLNVGGNDSGVESGTNVLISNRLCGHLQI